MVFKLGIQDSVLLHLGLDMMLLLFDDSLCFFQFDCQFLVLVLSNLCFLLCILCFVLQLLQLNCQSFYDFIHHLFITIFQSLQKCSQNWQVLNSSIKVLRVYQNLLVWLNVPIHLQTCLQMPLQLICYFDIVCVLSEVIVAIHIKSLEILSHFHSAFSGSPRVIVQSRGSPLCREDIALVPLSAVAGDGCVAGVVQALSVSVREPWFYKTVFDFLSSFVFGLLGLYLLDDALVGCGCRLFGAEVGTAFAFL